MNNDNYNNNLCIPQQEYVLLYIVTKSDIEGVLETLKTSGLCNYFSYIFSTSEKRFLNIKTGKYTRFNGSKRDFMNWLLQSERLYIHLGIPLSEARKLKRSLVYIDDNIEDGYYNFCRKYNPVDVKLPSEGTGLNQGTFDNIYNLLKIGYYNFLFFDFDCTITNKHKFKTMHGFNGYPKPYNWTDMGDDERELWFLGGQDRLDMLVDNFEKLSNFSDN